MPVTNEHVEDEEPSDSGVISITDATDSPENNNDVSDSGVMYTVSTSTPEESVSIPAQMQPPAG